MKLETKIKDLRLVIAAAEQAAKLSFARKHLDFVPTLGSEDDCCTATRAVVALRTEAEAAVNKIPKPRRDAAQRMHASALSRARSVACYGGLYSGDTSCTSSFGSTAVAKTITSSGGRYSRGCRYTKTNANHHVGLDPAGIPLLMDADELRRASTAEGLHLIALYPGNAAVWVRTKGKAIVSERGWVAYEDNVIYHSSESLGHANRGLAKKLKVIREEQALRDPKVQRRIKLIARLCGDTKATIEDAKSLGFCDPGIKAFQDRFGIKDSASLPDLIKTGDPSAVRLALHLAKKIHLKNNK